MKDSVVGVPAELLCGNLLNTSYCHLNTLFGNNLAEFSDSHYTASTLGPILKLVKPIYIRHL